MLPSLSATDSEVVPLSGDAPAGPGKSHGFSLSINDHGSPAENTVAMEESMFIARLTAYSG